jgi:UDP-3-O-[3-hydroxymyristoyl] glucosamine N-acyltransferase
MVTLDQLAKAIGAQLRGDGDVQVTGVGTLTGAKPDQLTFLANPHYRKQLANTRAAAVVVTPDDADHCPVAALVCEDPYVGYAKAAMNFDRNHQFQPGIHPSAVVAEDAELGDGVFIGPLAVVESGAQIGAGCQIGAGSVVGADCQVGNQCLLHPRATLCHGTILGRRVIVHSGAVIGSDGFGLAMDHGQWLKVPQLGRVRIGDDCEIGANTSIDRGAIDDTVLEQDVRLDNQIQIAHNVHIGAHTAMAGCSAVAGSARIGSYCLIGGGAGILGHLDIADQVTVTAMTLVTHSIGEAGEYSSGSPLQTNKQWRRNAVRVRQLDQLARRLIKIEKER